jgi:UDP-N-acetylglucosamine--N-acetylmuramyl-(pentapeptide) pyrophosphoryl-undecaprenol N-acetylglucosamine transferase
MSNSNNIHIIISGGGTGGHIFPALSIADEIKSRIPDADILFVGAKDRMEMERVPAAGYRIEGLPVRGLKRKLTLENISILRDFLKSQRMARNIIKEFKPVIVIGVGGYASAPVLRAASRMGIPCLLQEQNSYAGVTNRLLAKKSSTICVAYEGMAKYFPSEKLVYTGNPVRNIILNEELKKEGRLHFNLKTENPVLFIMGGSLGARTLNRSMLRNIDQLSAMDIEIIWQTGKIYSEAIREDLKNKALPNIHVLDFVSRMDLAYNVADLLVSRAGALSLSEICVTGKPSVLVPSPNVAEDHQTKNAQALVNAGAAIMVKDIEAEEKLIDQAVALLTDKNKLTELGNNALKLAKPFATKAIVDEVFKLIR